MVDPDDPALQHVGVVSDTYTVLVTAEQTAGRYAMLIPPGGGPPAHRHDFEEQFHLLDGEIEVTFRGEKTTVRTGQTVNVPARAPHHFTNVSDHPAVDADLGDLDALTAAARGADGVGVRGTWFSTLSSAIGPARQNRTGVAELPPACR